MLFSAHVVCVRKKTIFAFPKYRIPMNLLYFDMLFHPLRPVMFKAGKRMFRSSPPPPISPAAVFKKSYRGKFVISAWPENHARVRYVLLH